MSKDKMDDISPVHTSEPMALRLWEALRRIKNGTPNDERLAIQAKAGTLRPNISSVAQEAKCSRTLVGYAGCKYPEIRRAILEADDQTGAPSRARATVVSLFETIGELESKLKIRRKNYSQFKGQLRATTGGMIGAVTTVESSTEIESAVTSFDQNQSKKLQISWLRKRIARLKTAFAECDTNSANLILQVQAYESGVGADGKVMVRASNLKKRQALSVVGRNK